MPPILRIQLLGEFRLFIDDQPAHLLDRPRQQSLLAYLLLHRHAPQQRQQIAFRLWPDSSESQAHTNLRKLIFQLRRALPNADDLLFADMQHLGWQQNARYGFDVAELELALDALEQGGAPALSTVEKVLALYQGELLPTCYEEWILPLRRALHERVVNRLETALEGMVEQRVYEPARRVAEHLLRLDPLHEAAYRHLMHLRALSGDRAGALRLYHECVTVLEQELGVLPASETQALYQHLLKVQDSSPLESAAQTLHSVKIPLVGRQREWQKLQQSWRESTHGPRMMTLWGEAGVGKTRLVEELVRWARLRPGSVAYARCYAAEGSLAYAPLTEWLRSEALRPAVLQAETIWLAELARLLPEVQKRHGDLPAPLPMSEGWQRQRFYEALAHVVLAAARPLLLVLDDLQWCDVETLAWLRYLMRFDAHAPLLVVGTVRSEAIDEQHPVHELRRQLQRSGQEVTVELAPLSVEETAQLARHVAGEDMTEWIALLYRETEGNPLFVVEMVRAGVIRDHGNGQKGQNTTLPPTVHAVISARLGQLSAPARQLAQTAATVGRAFTVDVLAAATDTSRDLLVQPLDELWQRRIIYERGPGYDFSHDKIREVAYGSLGPVRRRHLHRQVAEGVERLHAGQLGEVAGQLATHYSEAGYPEKALFYLLQAGDRAKRLSANHEALRYYQQALSLAGVDQADAILAQRANVYLDLYQGHEAATDYQHLLAHARRSRNRTQELEFLLGLMNAHYLVALDDQETDVALTLRQEYVTAKALARELGNKRSLVLSLLLPIWHFWPELRPQAMADAHEALLLSSELGDEELVLDSKLALLYNSDEQEQVTVGNELLEELEARGDLDRLNRATFYLMWTHYFLGNYERTVQLCDAGIALATKIGVLPVQYPTIKSFALLRLGRYGDAWDTLQEEIADEAHLLGRAFKETGLGMYLFEVGAYTLAASVFEAVVQQAGRLRRGWLCEWARLWLVRSLLRVGPVRQVEWARVNQAMANADQSVLDGLPPWLTLARIAQAEISLGQGKPEDALRQLEKATSVILVNGYQGEYSSALEFQARLLLQLNQPAPALALLDKAQLIAAGIHFVPLTWRIHVTRAQILERLEQREAAVTEWQKAAATMHDLAATIRDPELRHGFNRLQESLIISIPPYT